MGGGGYFYTFADQESFDQIPPKTQKITKRLTQRFRRVPFSKAIFSNSALLGAAAE